MERLTAKQILESRVLIHSAGKYTCKVTSVNPYTDPETGNSRTIVNFNAMTPYNASQATKAFKEGDYEASVGKGTSMSASQLNGQYIPSKGEIVDIEVVDYVTKDGENTIVVNTIVPRKAVAAKAFSLSLEEEEVENPDPQLVG